MTTSIVLFTRDLRLNDHPGICDALARGDEVVPLFVLDPAIIATAAGSPNRMAFLRDCLRDLDASLRSRASTLIVRRGDPAAELAIILDAVDARAVYIARDVTTYAKRRGERLSQVAAGRSAEVRWFAGNAVVEPGSALPSGRDHYAVFTPYWRRWRDEPLEPPRRAPTRIPIPARAIALASPGIEALMGPADGALSASAPRGGETEGRALLGRWLATSLGTYGSDRDALSVDGTSRLSPYLHFGCLSAREVAFRAARAPSSDGAEAFLRQLAWRDFFTQVHAARPANARRDYRARPVAWRDDPAALDAWKQGRTGVPIVDAGMRQLREEGWMHGRARMVTASFLCRDLGIDWRLGADHFERLLVDADLAVNRGNWQWVAGTGNSSRPNQTLNVLRQAVRFDRSGDYVRRYVEELSGLEGGAVHRPWERPVTRRGRVDYPSPIRPV